MIFNNSYLNLLHVKRFKINKRKKVPEWKYPHSLEKKYVIDLLQLVNQWKQIAIETVIPQIADLENDFSFQRPMIFDSKEIRKDDYVDKLERIMEAYKLRIGLDEIKAVSELNFTATEINNFNVQQWFKISEAVMSVPLIQSELWLQPVIKSFVKENIDLITNLKNTTIEQIDTIINRGIKQGLRHETIKKQLLDSDFLKKGTFSKVEKRAALIARDQTAKLNGQLSKLRQTNVGIFKYIWRTMRDERVRYNHRQMDGLLCDWNDSSICSIDEGKTWISRLSFGGIDLHTGQDYQCRCFGEPDFSDFLKD